MLLVLDINDAPSILAASNRSTIDDEGAFATDDRKGNHSLCSRTMRLRLKTAKASAPGWPR